jgi:hypothetical protein
VLVHHRHKAGADDFLAEARQRDVTRITLVHRSVHELQAKGRFSVREPALCFGSGGRI